MLTIQDIIHRYVSGDKKYQLIKDIVDGRINLKQYEDIPKTRVYEKLFNDLKNDVALYNEKKNEKKAMNSSDEKKAKTIIHNANTKSDYFGYDIAKLNEYKERLELYLNSESVTSNTKNKLSTLLQDVTALIDEYNNKGNRKDEKTLRSLIDMYDKNKTQLYRIILQSEKELYKLASSKKLSTITQKRFNKILNEYREFKEKLETEYLVKGILYILKSSHNGIEENQQEFSMFYKKCHLKFKNGQLNEYLKDEEDYSLLETLLKEEEKIQNAESVLKQRGYDKDSIAFLKELLNYYENNIPFKNNSKKIGIANRTMSKNAISTYLVKFETEPILNPAELESYKAFAEEYGNRLLTWIILEKDIEGKDGISKEEIVSYCKMNDYNDSKTLQKRIDSIEDHLRIRDKSLHKEELETIENRITTFISKYISSKNNQKVKKEEHK